GVETVGTDAGQAGTFDPPFPNHSTMHGAGKFGITSLINLDQLPPTGAVIIAAPLKIANGSGSPLRVVELSTAYYREITWSWMLPSSWLKLVDVNCAPRNVQHSRA